MTTFTIPPMEIVEFQGRFVLVGILNANEAAEQIRYFRAEHNLKVEYQRPFGGGVMIISVFEDKNDLNNLHKIYEPLSRGYRGTYQAFAKGIVEAFCNIPDSKKV